MTRHTTIIRLVIHSSKEARSPGDRGTTKAKKKQPVKGLLRGYGLNSLLHISLARGVPNIRPVEIIRHFRISCLLDHLEPVNYFAVFRGLFAGAKLFSTVNH
jgi:hypothetical protein